MTRKRKRNDLVVVRVGRDGRLNRDSATEERLHGETSSFERKARELIVIANLALRHGDDASLREATEAMHEALSRNRPRGCKLAMVAAIVRDWSSAWARARSDDDERRRAIGKLLGRLGGAADGDARRLLHVPELMTIDASEAARVFSQMYDPSERGGRGRRSHDWAAAWLIVEARAFGEPRPDVDEGDPVERLALEVRAAVRHHTRNV
jgi:hypothetical protein